VKIGPGLDMVSMAPVDKTGDPGIGLRDVPHRVLTYRMLSAHEPNADTREPSRLLELHLTGNMERYMWSFDGRMFSAVSDVPIRFAWNERVRVKLVNNTIMGHPIHLHGMFFELVNGETPAHQPRKNVVIVQPGASATLDLTAISQLGSVSYRSRTRRAARSGSAAYRALATDTSDRCLSSARWPSSAKRGGTAPGDHGWSSCSRADRPSLPPWRWRTRMPAWSGR
jgi:FtsP/CotA-like multicopper oxidase with cupredoxin domain